MGAVADRTTTRWGKYRPYLLWMAIPFGLLGYLAFANPDFSQTGKLIYAYATYVGLMMAYTAINVPYSAWHWIKRGLDNLCRELCPELCRISLILLGNYRQSSATKLPTKTSFMFLKPVPLPYSALMGVMTPSSVERTSLSSFRFVGAFSGMLLISLTVRPLVRALGDGDEANGFKLTMALLSGVLAVANGIILLWYPLTEANVAEIEGALADRRAREERRNHRRRPSTTPCAV